MRQTESSNPRISPKREANIRQAFPYISWDFEYSQMKRYGLLGDRPSYYIPGRCGPLQIRLLTYGPGGSEQSLRIMDDEGRKIRTIRPAPFNKAGKIGHILKEEIRKHRDFLGNLIGPCG